MKKSYQTKSGYLFIYLFILASFFSCSKELIKVKEEPPTATSLNTKNITWGVIDTATLKRVFYIHSSFIKNEYEFEALANFLTYSMPGAEAMISDFYRFSQNVTLVYDPKMKFSYYGSYSGVSGPSVVLNSLNPDDILEEFFHAYWGLWMTRTGFISAAQEFEAQLDAKIYTSFVLSAQAAYKADPELGPKGTIVLGPIGFYAETYDIYWRNLRDDYFYYLRPGGDRITYEMSDELYHELYDAYARDDERPSKVGRYPVRDGRSLIYFLLNNR